MSDPLKSEIDAIFAAQEQAEQHKRRAAAEKREREDAQVRAFAALKEAVIVPTFSEFGALLKPRGHDFSIDDRPSPSSSIYQQVTFELRPNDHPANNVRPSLTASFDGVTGKVEFRQTYRGHHSKPVGEFALTAVTKDRLQQLLLDLLRQAVK
jgi:hypothetical protein